MMHLHRVSNARHAAFTLLELLVVISIIAVLASMTLVVSKKLMTGKKQQTETIIADVRKAIEMAAATSGGTIASAEHPLAGSRAPRFAFVTSSGATLGTGAISVGGVSVSGFKGPPRTFLDSSLTKRDIASCASGGAVSPYLLDGDDVYANSKVPGLFGVRRRYLGVMGSLQVAVTDYLRLKWFDEDAIRSGSINPITAFKGTTDAEVSGYPKRFQTPDQGMQDAINYGTAGLPIHSTEAVQRILSASGMQGELASLGALKAAYWKDSIYPTTYSAAIAVSVNIKTAEQALANDPSNTYGKSDATYTHSASIFFANGTSRSWVGLPLVLFQNVYPPDSEEPADLWKAGYIKNSSNKWESYRIPGLAIYDAWGHELLISMSSKNKLVVISAGEDGCFRWNPGKDRTLDTTNAAGDTPLGDDKDGSLDNIGDSMVGETF
jgi:prepilin-type N-terminal cleavage/methylation domain-containing protein